MKTLWFILLLWPGLATGQELAKHFRHEYKSKYFVFHYNDEITRAKPLTKFSDSFVDVVNRDFFKARFNYPIHVYVLKDRTAFKDFLVRKAGVSAPPGWGIYFPRKRAFVTHESSGYGTFAHEIMHALVGANLRNTPLWADEGIPSFFEKSFGYWSKDELILRFGFQNPWRIQQMGGTLPSLDLESIVKNKHPYGTSEKRMVSVFLYQHGKLREYLRLVSTNRKYGYSTFLEAAFSKHMSLLVPEWKKYLQEVHRNRNQILRIPGSMIFDSKEQYEAFMKAYGLR